MQTLCLESGLRTAPNWPKIRKMTITSHFSDMTSSLNFFAVVLFLLSSLVTGPSFFYKGLTRNSEIGNTSVWVLTNIWRLGRVMDTKFGMNVFNRMLLNAAKFQCYSFYCFSVIKGKSPRLGLISPRWYFSMCLENPEYYCFTHKLISVQLCHLTIYPPISSKKDLL